MASQRLPIHIDAQPGMAALDIELGRITVLIGVNGSGKSRIIMQLASEASRFFSARPVVLAEGWRSISPFVLHVDPGQTSNTIHEYKKKLPSNLSARIGEMLRTVAGKQPDVARKIKYAEAHTRWRDGGRDGPEPEMERSRLDVVIGLFNELCATTQMFHQDGKLWFSKDRDARYGPAGLSDGEKQLLLFTLDTLFFADPNSVFLIDEPELHLHPALAARLWGVVERERPEALFVYATNSLNFALRQDIDVRILLGGDGRPARVLTGLKDLPGHEAAEFLGALPAVVAADRVLVVEGTDESFDRDFYRWVLRDENVVVAPVGGCHEVRSAAQHAGLWKDVTTGVRIRGVVDRDYRTDSSIVSLRTDECAVLDLHEAESYLCDPELVARVAQKVNTALQPPTAEQVCDVIIEMFEAQMFKVAARRALEQLRLHIAPSVGRKSLLNCESEDQHRTALAEAAETERSKAEKLNACAAIAAFNEEVSRCRNAIRARDTAEMLRLLPAKNLLDKLAKLAGCQDGAALLRKLVREFEPAQFPHLDQLRRTISFDGSPRAAPSS
jgi:hypothetical protein